MNIFVGNLSFAATEGDVKKLFEGYGLVASAAIVMRKEKKVPKSRGFGFVQMPVEQEALAAIAALNGREFMDRVIDVNPARSKTGAQPESKFKEEMQPQATVEARQYPALNDEGARPYQIGRRPTFRRNGQERSGTYGSGRRTHSYIRRQRLAGLPEEPRPRKRIYDNPMRWRKKKPWQKKKPGEHKPWQKTETEGEVRPWKKPAGDAKPWRKSNRPPQKAGRRRIR